MELIPGTQACGKRLNLMLQNATSSSLAASGQNGTHASQMEADPDAARIQRSADACSGEGAGQQVLTAQADANIRFEKRYGTCSCASASRRGFVVITSSTRGKGLTRSLTSHPRGAKAEAASDPAGARPLIIKYALVLEDEE